MSIITIYSVLPVGGILSTEVAVLVPTVLSFPSSSARCFKTSSSTPAAEFGKGNYEYLCYGSQNPQALLRLTNLRPPLLQLLSSRIGLLFEVGLTRVHLGLVRFRDRRRCDISVSAVLLRPENRLVTIAKFFEAGDLGGQGSR